MKIVQKNIDELRFAEYNPRKMSQEQESALRDSLLRFGLVDPIVINTSPKRENVVVGGHQRCRVWKSLGHDTVPCVEVRVTLPMEKELNVRLNRNTGEFDFDLLREHFVDIDLSQWGFNATELSVLETQLNEELKKTSGEGESAGAGEAPEKQHTYTAKVSTPVYTPRGEKPELEELFDLSKVESLIAEIESVAAPEAVKQFLCAAAWRHAVFNYRNIAEYYCHCSPEIQDLIERSALVIIDFNRAIEHGFVEVNKRLQGMLQEDYEGDDDDDAE